MLRDRETPTKIFKELVDEIAMLMAYEATSELALEDATVETPLERSDRQAGERQEAHARSDPARRARDGRGHLPSRSVARVSDTSACIATTIRSNRSTTTSRCRATRPSAIFFCSTDAGDGWKRGRRGGSLKRAGATRIRFMCLVAAPEGVSDSPTAHPDVIVYCASLDRELNDAGIHPARPRRRRRPLFGTR